LSAGTDKGFNGVGEEILHARFPILGLSGLSRGQVQQFQRKNQRSVILHVAPYATKI
jgi:hypothetical protein